MPPKKLNLGCGGDHHQDAVNVDVRPEADPDECVDLAGEWPDRWIGVEEIRAYHVLEHLPNMREAIGEAHRVLTPGGLLKIRLPIGADAYADPTHQWGGLAGPWTWRTPEMIAEGPPWGEERPNWTLISRDVRLWAVGATIPGRLCKKLSIDIRMAITGPAEWCFTESNVSGEFLVVLRKR